MGHYLTASPCNEIANCNFNNPNTCEMTISY